MPSPQPGRPCVSGLRALVAASAVLACASSALLAAINQAGAAGQKGGAAAAKAQAAKPQPTYAANDSCALCHEDVAKAINARLHGSVLVQRERDGLGRNCQSCHGPSQKHLDDPAKVKPAYTATALGRRASGAMCLQCHGQQIPPLAWRTGDHHAGKVQCWDCHSKERPPKAHAEYAAKPDSSVCLQCHREVQGAFRLNSHHPVIVEQRIECSDCHKPHGRLRDREITELCRSCHTSRRGPFLHEHGAISGRLTTGCLECHNPHGSPSQRLLRFNGRGLCLQCHGDKVTHLVGPACWDCHKGHHGSNSSPFLLTP